MRQTTESQLAAVMMELRAQQIHQQQEQQQQWQQQQGEGKGGAGEEGEGGRLGAEATQVRGTRCPLMPC